VLNVALACLLRRLLRLLTRGGERDDVSREIEILVLRHQLRVLARGRRSRCAVVIASC
jgi:hypothetical protein